jgi:hypothetical protein
MEISEDVFYEEYKPVKNHLDDNASFDGCLFETYGEELDYIYELNKKSNKVWTIIEGDDDNMTYLAGFHIVNRFGFLVTEKEWVSGDEFVEINFD